MSVESRRATIARLITSEGAAGRPIAQDRDFLSLAERWIDDEIKMAELCRIYVDVRAERRMQTFDPRHRPEHAVLDKGPVLSSEDFLAELARLTGSDLDR
ncbi:hypothetical protein [Pararhizobium qamdonense]|uniref:hypothetical protein n=1 Tax=Pararhizobium qamdonense TaxID=3031126 RepID=UPI0023E1A7BD|nr:hypothetical protein [Pararhizobium qamdonense]